jgi:hypothetical protein
VISTGVLVVTGSDGRWHPGIGDPTLMGWVTVVAYAIAAALAFHAHRVAQRDTRALRLFWGAVTLLLAALCVNKQLDLQSWAAEIARDLARQQGWYARRRPIQVLAIVAFAVVSAAGVLSLAVALRSYLRALWIALLGVAELVVFVVIRASSFNKVDQLIGTTFVGARVNWILELSGIALVGWGAWGFARRCGGSHQHQGRRRPRCVARSERM